MNHTVKILFILTFFVSSPGLYAGKDNEGHIKKNPFLMKMSLKNDAGLSDEEATRLTSRENIQELVDIVDQHDPNSPIHNAICIECNQPAPEQNNVFQGNNDTPIGLELLIQNDSSSDEGDFEITKFAFETFEESACKKQSVPQADSLKKSELNSHKNHKPMIIDEDEDDLQNALAASVMHQDHDQDDDQDDELEKALRESMQTYQATQSDNMEIDGHQFLEAVKANNVETVFEMINAVDQTILQQAVEIVFSTGNGILTDIILNRQSELAEQNNVPSLSSMVSNQLSDQRAVPTKQNDSTSQAVVNNHNEAIFLEILASEATTPNPHTVSEILENNGPTLFSERRENGDNIFHVLLHRALNNPEFIALVNEAIMMDQDRKALTAANNNNQTPLSLAQEYLRQQEYFGDSVGLLHNLVGDELGENQDEQDLSSDDDSFHTPEEDDVRAPMEFEAAQLISDEEIQYAEEYFFATERNIANILSHQNKQRAVQYANELINQGVSVTEPNDQGYTPLMVAARMGMRELARKLIALGADPCQINNFGENVLLHMLANPSNGRGRQLSFEQMDVFYFLLASENSKQILEAVTNLGNSLTLTAQTGESKLLEIILGINPSLLDQANNAGQTALHIAMINGDIKIVELLLERGATTNTQDMHGNSPLNSAIQAGQVNLIGRLVKSGVVNLNEEQYFAVLLKAVEQRKANLVELFILARDPQASEKARQTLMKTTQLSNNAENDVRIAQLLTLSDELYNNVNFIIKLARLTNPSDSNIIRYAQDGNAEAIEEVKVGDFNAPNAWGLTPIMIATVLGYQKCVSRLLTKGADTNILLGNLSLADILNLLLENDLLGFDGGQFYDLLDRIEQLQDQGKIAEARTKKQLLREAALKRFEQNNQQ